MSAVSHCCPPLIAEAILISGLRSYWDRWHKLGHRDPSHRHQTESMGSPSDFSFGYFPHTQGLKQRHSRDPPRRLESIMEMTYTMNIVAEAKMEMTTSKKTRRPKLGAFRLLPPISASASRSTYQFTSSFAASTRTIPLGPYKIWLLVPALASQQLPSAKLPFMATERQKSTHRLTAVILVYPQAVGLRLFSRTSEPTKR